MSAGEYAVVRSQGDHLTIVSRHTTHIRAGEDARDRKLRSPRHEYAVIRVELTTNDVAYHAEQERARELRKEG